MFCLPVCVYSICVPSTLGGQNIVRNPRELEVQVVVTHQVCAWNQTGSSLRAASVLTTKPISKHISSVVIIKE